jgi:hypothetical protein
MSSVARGPANTFRAAVPALGGGFFPPDIYPSTHNPDAPNDVAPRGYNDPEPPATLPASPLAPPAKQRGLSWRG